ncbi:MAG TPA: phosphatase PAP2 family protein [Candidatus Acidoferrales bacterium]|nr:phosphatase PAP2 family protein [Candidatus Acidoferrales bacterium]
MTATRAVWNRIQSGDHRIMRSVHHWRPPKWFRKAMVIFTRMGDGWLWYALAAGILLFGGPHRFLALASAASAAGAGILIFMGVKRVSRRQRPCELEPHCWSMIAPPDEFSFPSGHAITAFAIAVSLEFFYPGLGWALLFVAFGIAASRIVLGMHFLSDVLAGSSIGALLGFSAVHLLNSL